LGLVSKYRFFVAQMEELLVEFYPERITHVVEEDLEFFDGFH
jgi:hypothetical protein